MSAIEKYLKNKFNTNSIESDCREAVAYIKGFGEGWKEALEWALNQLEMEEDYDIFVNRIQKELEQ